MARNIGTQLCSLEVTALIGRGGMVEVYRARDTKLKRDVAIKILPDESKQKNCSVCAVSFNCGPEPGHDQCWCEAA